MERVYNLCSWILTKAKATSCYLIF